MQVKITRTALPGGQPRVEVFGDVLDVQVDPIDGDNRSQAERNADNAFSAARLRRVEARLRQRIEHLELLAASGGKRVAVDAVLGELRVCLEARVE